MSKEIWIYPPNYKDITMELALLLGLTLTFNIIILFIKYNAGRYVDLFFDITLLLAIGFITAGSVAGLAAGMLASTIISLFLLFKTPKIVKDLQEDEDLIPPTNHQVSSDNTFVFQF